MNESHPGSESFQRGRSETAGSPVAPVEDPLDGIPAEVYLVGNAHVSFYKIGVLAGILGRKAGTLRKWENDGVIPAASFQVGGGGDPRGRRRLYSRAQVLGIWKIAGEEGLIGTGKHIAKTSFVERVKEGWPFDNQEGS